MSPRLRIAETEPQLNHSINSSRTGAQENKTPVRVQGETWHPCNMSGQEVSSAQVQAQFTSLFKLKSSGPNFSLSSEPFV